jgi:hypothetical protein
MYNRQEVCFTALIVNKKEITAIVAVMVTAIIALRQANII